MLSDVRGSEERSEELSEDLSQDRSEDRPTRDNAAGQKHCTLTGTCLCPKGGGVKFVWDSGLCLVVATGLNTATRVLGFGRSNRGAFARRKIPLELEYKAQVEGTSTTLSIEKKTYSGTIVLLFGKRG